jgi:hypothetical protein
VLNEQGASFSFFTSAMRESQQPLLEPSASKRMVKAHSSTRHRAVVLVLILLGALALAQLLPTNKNLPCPYCTISGWIGWLYFLAWSVRYVGQPNVYTGLLMPTCGPCQCTAAAPLSKSPCSCYIDWDCYRYVQRSNCPPAPVTTVVSLLL